MQEHERQTQQQAAAHDFRAYLNPLGYLETHYTRMMSSLSSVAYRMDRLTPAYLRRMHGLELRYSSLACERALAPAPQPHLEALDYGDGALLLCRVRRARAPLCTVPTCPADLSADAGIQALLSGSLATSPVPMPGSVQLSKPHLLKLSAYVP